jgi:hypothetical protein
MFKAGCPARLPRFHKIRKGLAHLPGPAPVTRNTLMVALER